MKNLLVVSTLVSLVLLGCGGKLAPLTSEQKADVSATVSSFSNIMASAMILKSGGNREWNEESEPYKLYLVLKNNCSATISTNDHSYSVGGANCPIEFSVSVTGDIVSMDGHTDSKVHYALKNPASEFGQLVSVTAMDLTGSADQKTISLNPFNFEGSGKLNGTITSKTYGAVKLTMTTSSKIEAAEKTSKNVFNNLTMLEFKNFTAKAEFKMTSENFADGTNKTDSHYYLNDEEVTETEFMKFGNSPQPHNRTRALSGILAY